MILYSMRKFKEIQEEKSYDAFFCADGLEGRDVRVVELFSQNKKLSVKKWVIFHYKEREADKQGDKSKLMTYLEGERVANILTSYQDPRSYSQILQEILQEMKGYKNVGIDITGFKNQFFFPLLKIFAQKSQIEKLDVFYTEPSTYRFPKKKTGIDYFPNMQKDQRVFFNYSKTEGGVEIKSIPGFEGGRAKKTVLVILIGFDGKVAVRIKEEYNAEKVLLINGFPSYLPKFRDISLLNNKELVNGSRKDEIFNTYADNPFEVYNVLDRIKRTYEDYKLLVAPLGAKPLALGVCKFGLDFPQTAVLYVESSKYVEESTEDYGETWEYQLELKKNVLCEENGKWKK
ncbi:MAG: hypothetical protein NC293_00440 [Roseburia sp.]|nr:hypothetical protein [Roseburia sp.]